MQTIATVKKNGFQRENMYDFMEHRRWLLVAMGYGQSRSRAYFFYKVALLVFIVCVTAQALYTITKLTNKMDIVANALHSFLISLFGLGGILIAFSSYRDLIAGQQTLLSGFYHYQGEELDTEGQKIVDGALARVIRNVNRATKFPIAAFWSSFSSGILALLFMTEEEYEDVMNYYNPLMPLCLYLPFSTRSRLGFIGGYIITLSMTVLIYGLAFVLMQIFVSLTEQLSIQLELLNHSIQTLLERADRMYAQYFGKILSGERPFAQPEYQACLYKCLRSNIQHHQALKKYKNNTHRFTGSLLFLLFVMDALAFGTKLYLILKRPTLDKLIPYCITLLMEQFYFLGLCFYGEIIMQKSGMLFASLYKSQFSDCNKSFNKVLNIFMVYTREPMAVKMIIFDIKACMEFYADLVCEGSGPETIQHVISGCPRYAQREYRQRHYDMGKIVHQEFAKDLGLIEQSMAYCRYQPAAAVLDIEKSLTSILLAGLMIFLCFLNN